MDCPESPLRGIVTARDGMATGFRGGLVLGRVKKNAKLHVSRERRQPGRDSFAGFITKRAETSPSSGLGRLGLK